MRPGADLSRRFYRIRLSKWAMRIVFIIVISALFIAALLWTRPDTYAELRELPPPTVKIGQVRVKDLQPVTRVTGKLQPARRANLHFQVAGQVDARLVEAGQPVAAGAILLSIENGDFIDAAAESEALLKTERDALRRDSRLLELMRQERQLQEQEVARLERLGQQSLSSKSNYDQARQVLYRQQAEEARLQHGVDAVRSRLLIEQARLNKAERNLRRTRLKAPFSGTVNRVHVEVGDYVAPGQAALEIVELARLDLNLEVTGLTAAELSLGQKIRVETGQGRREGRIIALAVDPDPDTNTHSLKIRLPSAGLFAGRLAVAELPGRYYAGASVVPVSAVLHEDGESYVFGYANDRVYRRPVTLLARFEDLHIVAGIAAGSEIVSGDIAGLADGQLVVVY